LTQLRLFKDAFAEEVPGVFIFRAPLAIEAVRAV